jgi:5-methylcytosine-specific restriction enzyme subunit McrC
VSPEPPQILELFEYRPVELPKSGLDRELARQLWQEFGTKVSVEEPGFRNDDHWRLTSQGWVGYIPLSDELHLALRPKVSIENLFGMLEYAYDIRFEVPDIVGCGSLQQFYERLAKVLALRVLDRGRKGYYRTYLEGTDCLPYLRGQLDIRRLALTPWDPNMHCSFDEHTGDVEDNQILAWTLHKIARSGLCTQHSLPEVRQAYRSVQAFVTLTPFLPESCVRRLYNRLNDDYQPLHALCRFFLENSGPTYQSGDRDMLTFLIDMERLFELFVAKWLQKHLPKELALRVQEKVDLTVDGDLSFRIDLVLYDSATDSPLAVLDTKYKVPDAPSTDDIAKVMAYAATKQCPEAVLIYPTPLSKPFDEQPAPHIHVRSLTFGLGGDLEEAGGAFIDSLSLM